MKKTFKVSLTERLNNDFEKVTKKGVSNYMEKMPELFQISLHRSLKYLYENPRENFEEILKSFRKQKREDHHDLDDYECDFDECIVKTFEKMYYKQGHHISSKMANESKGEKILIYFIRFGLQKIITDYEGQKDQNKESFTFDMYLSNTSIDEDAERNLSLCYEQKFSIPWSEDKRGRSVARSIIKIVSKERRLQFKEKLSEDQIDQIIERSKKIFKQVRDHKNNSDKQLLDLLKDTRVIYAEKELLDELAIKIYENHKDKFSEFL